MALVIFCYEYNMHKEMKLQGVTLIYCIKDDVMCSPNVS